MKEENTHKLNKSFIIKIIIGLILGIVLGVVYHVISMSHPDDSLLILNILDVFKILGTLFVNALKGIAPILVFVLVATSISRHKKDEGSNMGSIVKLYLMATFISAIVAVIMSFLFPVDLALKGVEAASEAAPESVIEVLRDTLLSVVDNPVNALVTGNYLGVLFWAVLLGMGLNKASEATKNIFQDIADAVSFIIQKIISFAPIGIFGLVFKTISENGLVVLLNYSKLILLLVSTMIIVFLGLFAIITYIYTKENPYPLIFKILKTSGLTAFTTRSSAANIPINLELCKELDVNPELYNVSIPLGSTINMSGAAITITTLSLAAANTVGIEVNFLTAIFLSIIAAISACGASGVASGSILLVPIGCALLGIDNNVAMQVVEIGFIISVVQDSCETALNSSGDALFTILVDKRYKRLKKKNQD